MLWLRTPGLPLREIVLPMSSRCPFPIAFSIMVANITMPSRRATRGERPAFLLPSVRLGHLGAQPFSRITAAAVIAARRTGPARISCFGEVKTGAGADAGPSSVAMDLSPPSPVRVRRSPEGLLTYMIDMAPEELPRVRGRDLERAWYAAREAAIASAWGAARGFRFRRADGSVIELALSDRDAACWAGAVDSTVGLSSSYGLSVCLRLLAMVDLLARAAWAAPFCQLAPDGAELDLALLRAAAAAPLNADLRFEEAPFRTYLGRPALDAPAGASSYPGGPA